MKVQSCYQTIHVSIHAHSEVCEPLFSGVLHVLVTFRSPLPALLRSEGREPGLKMYCVSMKLHREGCCGLAYVNMWFSLGWHGNLFLWLLVAPPIHTTGVAIISSIAIITVEIATKATCKKQGHSWSPEKQHSIKPNWYTDESVGELKRLNILTGFRWDWQMGFLHAILGIY